MTVHPKIKLIQGRTPSDPGGDPAEYKPEDPTYFGIEIMLWIGPEEPDIHDFFNLWICSPSWFADNHMYGPVQPVCARLFQKKWDWPLAHAYIEEHISDCTGETWTQCALKISILAGWEFFHQAIDELNLPD